jgi:outer membrane protein OmpA-like peptidoglycan-associated protein
MATEEHYEARIQHHHGRRHRHVISNIRTAEFWAGCTDPGRHRARLAAGSVGAAGRPPGPAHHWRPGAPGAKQQLHKGVDVGGAVNSDTKGAKTAEPRDKATASIAVPQGCPAQPDTNGQPMIDFKVAFEFGSAQLKPESIETLRRLGQALNAPAPAGLSDQKKFAIEGHTDAVGSLPYNERLSALRAAAVKDFLIKEMGVSPERLSSAGKAFCEPLDPTDPKGADNRRVVVINQAS